MRALAREPGGELGAGMNTELIRDVLPALDCDAAPGSCAGEDEALLAPVRRIDGHAAALDRYLALVPERL